MRGPFLFSQSPPKNEAKPKQKMAIVKVSVTCEMVQPNCLTSGVRKTLQAYTAPKAICMQTPATAISQRLARGCWSSD
jgi:hypothetical protein